MRYLAYVLDYQQINISIFISIDRPEQKTRYENYQSIKTLAGISNICNRWELAKTKKTYRSLFCLGHKKISYLKK
jgi:hypothetical protein